ncbi:MAG: hypothetical protein ABIO81_13400, partial [Ginsengibacter sp.]
MKISLSYIFFSVLVFINFIGCRKTEDHVLPPLTETYRKTDKHPFGTFVAYNQFRHLFDDRYVEEIDEPFDEVWKNIKSYATDKKYSLYFLITKNLVLNYDEVKAFLEY